MAATGVKAMQANMMTGAKATRVSRQSWVAAGVIQLQFVTLRATLVIAIDE